MQNSHCLLGLVIEGGTLLWCSTHEQGRAGRLGGGYFERHLAGTKGVRGAAAGPRRVRGHQVEADLTWQRSGQLELCCQGAD